MANTTLRNFTEVGIGAANANLAGVANTDYVAFQLVPDQNLGFGSEGIRDTVDEGDTVQHGLNDTVTFYSFDKDIATATLSAVDYVGQGGTIAPKSKIGFVGAGSTDDVVYDNVILNGKYDRSTFERTAIEVTFTKTSDSQLGNDTLA